MENPLHPLSIALSDVLHRGKSISNKCKGQSKQECRYLLLVVEERARRECLRSRKEYIRAHSSILRPQASGLRLHGVTIDPQTHTPSDANHEPNKLIGSATPSESPHSLYTPTAAATCTTDDYSTA